MTKLILVRHGQSTWNADNKFTGWVDASLSSKGISEAKKAGVLIKKENLKINRCYTSYLTRAIDTLEILLKESGNLDLKINKFWQLNERHYGALTGLNKKQTLKKLGPEVFLKYRRSWAIAPPIMQDDNIYKEQFGKLNKSISISSIPKTESLKDTYERVIKFYKKNVLNSLKKNNTIIISAHGNSLRALCKYLLSISDEKISQLEVPTGNPLLINFNYYLKITDLKYLDEKRSEPIPHKLR